jgi:hypothetical protein
MIPQKANNAAQLMRFNRVKPGGGFIQTDHFRPGAHCPRNFQTPLLAVRHLSRQAIGALHQIHHFQPVEGPVQGVAFRPPVCRRI